MDTAETQLTARVAPWSTEEAALDPRIKRRLFTSSRAMVVVSSLPLSNSPWHVHPVDQVVAVITGLVELRVGRTLRVLKPGEACLVPAGAFHSARSLGDQEAETFNVFSPDDLPTE